MKKFIPFLALAALSLAACDKQQELIPSAPAGEDVIITASRDGSTRTAVQPDGKSVWWSAEESIDVFYGPGETPAVFKGTNDAPAATAQFSGRLDLSTPGQTYYAIYPSSEVSTVQANGEMTLSLKASQASKAGTFADGVFPAVAVSDNTTMSFLNVAGGIKFTIGKDNVTEVEFKANGGEGLAGNISVALVDGKPEVTYLDSPSSTVTVYASEGSFKKGVEYYAAMLPTTLSKGVTITLKRDDAQPLVIESTKSAEIKRSTFHNVGELSGPKELTIESVWALFSSDEGSWNKSFGGLANSDRNIAMDDDYVYVAETPVEQDVDSQKLWAISTSDYKKVKLVNTEGVSGGAKSLCCPRVIKNTDASVNGGKDVLVCCNLTRGDADPILYMWVNGIDKAPMAVLLKTYTTDWYGDTFTVYGTLQDGILFFDKTNGGGMAGVVTFNLKGVPAGETPTLYLAKRIKFPEAFGGHTGVCAFYPYPETPYEGVYSPGRGVEARGQLVSFTGDLYDGNNAAYVPTFTPMEYAEGRNGYILGYNFIEWKGKRYVIYGKQPDRNEGKVYILEGELTDSWATIINFADVKFRRDLQVTSGSLESGSTAMDVTARIIDGELYIAAQKQNVACGLYRLTYK